MTTRNLTPAGDVVGRMDSVGYLTSLPTRLADCACGRQAFTQLQSPLSGQWAPETCDLCASEASARRPPSLEIDERHVAARLKRLGLPAQYADADLTRVPIIGGDKTRALLAKKRELARRYIEAWPSRRDNPRFPVLAAMRGAPGTFKTYTASAIARALVLRYDASVRIATLGDIVRDIRETWRRGWDEESEAKRIARWRKPDLLVIDEVSRHALFGEPVQHLYDIVADREADLAPTILTTNEAPGDFEHLVGAALTSRIARWGEMWEFGDEDLRPTLHKYVRAGLDPDDGTPD